MDFHLSLSDLALAKSNFCRYVRGVKIKGRNNEMNKFVNEVMMKKVERTMKALDAHHFNPKFVQNRHEALELVKLMLNKADKVGVGGSATLNEVGIIQELKSGKYNFIESQAPNLSDEERRARYLDCFMSDVYLSSSNAITEDGFLYNVDGRSNRVAAMLYGPNKVIIVAGVNKIVRDIDEAIKRNREIAAPANALRLNKKTPCAKMLKCCDCKSPERICRNYVLMGPQGLKDRVHVILVNESLGF